MAMSVPDRVKKNTMSIMRHKKFCAFSGVVACGKVTYTNTGSASTDGWNTSYSEAFIRKEAPTEPKLRFLMLHEAMHKAYRHMHVWRELWKENASLANKAMDQFVNLGLVLTDAGEGFIEMLSVGVMPDMKYKGWSVVMIYNDMKKEQGKKPPPKGPKPPPGETGDCPQPPGDEPGEQGDEPGEPGDGFDEHDWEGADGGDKEVDKKREEEIERAIRQGEMMRKKLAGKGSGNEDGVFGDLLNPKIDWKKVLRDFVTELCAGKDESSWRKPNRRLIADDIIMPSLMGTTLTELVVGFDTSGSIFGGDLMTRFVTEIATIITQVCPKKIHVIYCDSSVRGVQTFEDGQFAVQDLKIVGGGGTDLTCIFDWVQSSGMKPDAAVILTDGYTPFGGAQKYPVLWAITSDVQAPFGTTIKVEA